MTMKITIFGHNDANYKTYFLSATNYELTLNYLKFTDQIW